MDGFSEVFGVAMNDDGSIDPLSQLFRANFVGVETGPMMSQVKRASARIVLCLLALHTSEVHDLTWYLLNVTVKLNSECTYRGFVLLAFPSLPVFACLTFGS